MTDGRDSRLVPDGGRIPTDPVGRERLGVRLLLAGILIAVIITLVALLGGPSLTIGFWFGIAVGLVGLVIAAAYGMLDLGRAYGLGLVLTILGLLVAGYGFEREILPILLLGVVLALVGLGAGSYRVRV